MFPWVNLFLYLHAQDPSHAGEMVPSGSLFHLNPANRPHSQSVTPSCINLVITISPTTSLSLPTARRCQDVAAEQHPSHSICRVEGKEFRCLHPVSNTYVWLGWYKPTHLRKRAEGMSRYSAGSEEVHFKGYVKMK